MVWRHTESHKRCRETRTQHIESAHSTHHIESNLHTHQAPSSPSPTDEAECSIKKRIRADESSQPSLTNILQGANLSRLRLLRFPCLFLRLFVLFVCLFSCSSNHIFQTNLLPSKLSSPIKTESQLLRFPCFLLKFSFLSLPLLNDIVFPLLKRQKPSLLMSHHL